MLIKVAFALVAIVAIAFGGIFYNDYMGQTARAESITSEIRNDKNSGTIVTKNVQKANQEIQDLAGKSESLVQEIKVQEGILPEKISSNVVLKDVISRGKQCSVSIIPLSTDEWSKTQINQISYQVLRINLEIKGRQDNVVSFIGSMQHTPYQTLVMDRLKIHRPADPFDNDIIADINLEIYAK